MIESIPHNFKMRRRKCMECGEMFYTTSPNYKNVNRCPVCREKYKRLKNKIWCFKYRTLIRNNLLDKVKKI